MTGAVPRRAWGRSTSTSPGAFSSSHAMSAGPKPSLALVLAGTTSVS
jgi:hypothetical protein